MPIKLYVGVDLGTTFTGVAFASASEKIIYTIDRWPDSERNQPKVPTRLCYVDDSLCGWGFSRPDIDYGLIDVKIVERFKLMIDPTIQIDENSNSTGLDRISKASRYYTDFLDCLYNHIKAELQQSFPDAWSEEVEFTFSVPNIYGPHIIARFRDLIEAAGFGGGKHHVSVVSLTESQAAIIYAAKSLAIFKNDDLVLACDAGGGTTDCGLLKIVYEEGSPLQLEEVSPAFGIKVGSTDINNAILELVLSQLEKIGSEDLYRQHVRSVNACIETYKTRFTIYTTLPLIVHFNNPAGTIKRIISIESEEVAQIFDDIAERISQCITTELRSSSLSAILEASDVYIVLCGGLGSSPYLRAQLENLLSDSYRSAPSPVSHARFVDIQDPQLVVAKGLIAERMWAAAETKDAWMEVPQRPPIAYEDTLSSLWSQPQKSNDFQRSPQLSASRYLSRPIIYHGRVSHLAIDDDIIENQRVSTEGYVDQNNSQRQFKRYSWSSHEDLTVKRSHMTENRNEGESTPSETTSIASIKRKIMRDRSASPMDEKELPVSEYLYPPTAAAEIQEVAHRSRQFSPRRLSSRPHDTRSTLTSYMSALGDINSDLDDPGSDDDARVTLPLREFALQQLDKEEPMKSTADGYVYVSDEELGAMLNFTSHARDCKHCNFLRGNRLTGTLCWAGNNYALEVKKYMYSEEGKLYSVSAGQQGSQKFQFHLPSVLYLVERLCRGIEKAETMRRDARKDRAFEALEKQSGTPGMTHLGQTEPMIANPSIPAAVSQEEKLSTSPPPILLYSPKAKRAAGRKDRIAEFVGDLTDQGGTSDSTDAMPKRTSSWSETEMEAQDLELFTAKPSVTQGASDDNIDRLDNWPHLDKPAGGNLGIVDDGNDRPLLSPIPATFTMWSGSRDDSIAEVAFDLGIAQDDLGYNQVTHGGDLDAPLHRIQGSHCGDSVNSISLDTQDDDGVRNRSSRRAQLARAAQSRSSATSSRPLIEAPRSRRTEPQIINATVGSNTSQDGEELNGLRRKKMFRFSDAGPPLVSEITATPSGDLEAKFNTNYKATYPSSRISLEPKLQKLATDEVRKQPKSIFRKQKCRVSYGVLKLELYDESRHLRQDMWRFPLNGKLYVENIIVWVIKQGDEIDDDWTTRFLCQKMLSEKEHAGKKYIFQTHLVISDKKAHQLPSSMTQGGAQALCNIEADLSTFSLSDFEKHIHKESMFKKKIFYLVQYHVAASSSSAAIVFEVLFKGKTSEHRVETRLMWHDVAQQAPATLTPDVGSLPAIQKASKAQIDTRRPRYG